MPRPAPWETVTGHALPLFSLAALTILVKLPTLGTPAYWDEMGWLAQAHRLSEHGFRTAIPGLRPADAFWGHPPGLHLTLAALGRSLGVSVTVAHALIAGFAALGICATFLLARRFYGSGTAWLAALALLLSPLYFAQSGMFLADVPVTALGALSIYFALENRYTPYCVCASCMVLVKETAIALVVAVLLYRFVVQSPLRRIKPRELAKFSVPLLVIGAFFLLQRITTGKFFFIYDFEIELFQQTPRLVWRQFELVTQWIFVEQLRFVFTGLIALNLIIHARARRRRELWLFLFVVALSGYSFSILYFLPRYLLPVLPFFYILAAVSVLDLVRSKRLQQPVAGAAMLGMMVWSLTVQPLSGNGEWSPRYRDVIAMHKAATDRIATEFLGGRVLTTWPHTAELESPLQGYVQTPIHAKRFRTVADLPGSDLILVSRPADGSENRLRDLAQGKAWRLVMRLEKEGAWTELYVLTAPPAPPAKPPDRARP